MGDITNENRTVLDAKIPEKTTPEITATIQDEDGNGIDAADLTTLTLTLYNLDDAAKTIINNRDDQDVLNTNNVTVSNVGALVWSVQALDTIIVGSKATELHRAVFEFTYNSGAKNGKHIIDMTIINLAKIT